MGDLPPMETEPTFTVEEWRRDIIFTLYLGGAKTGPGLHTGYSYYIQWG
jgi:hypothetical protein